MGVNSIMENKFERLERTLVAKGSIIDYYQDTIKVPNGNIVKWDFISHNGAAAILPVCDDGRIIMVRQYRSALERETIEIPAGGRNGEEETRVAAIRELEEETGYQSDDVEFLISVRTAVAFCEEKIDIYVAKNLKKTEQNLDEDEFIQIEYYTMDELEKMIFSGVIEDGKTIAAVMSYKSKYM